MTDHSSDTPAILLVEITLKQVTSIAISAAIVTSIIVMVCCMSAEQLQFRQNPSTFNDKIKSMDHSQPSSPVYSLYFYL